MNALKIAQEFEEYLKEIEELPWGNHQILCDQAATMLRQQQEQINNLKQWEKRHLDLIDILNGRIERMIENASHHEGIAHAGGFEAGYEAGRKMGMQQERALWELAASTQEIEQHLTAADAPFQKPAPKELADKIDKALGIKR